MERLRLREEGGFTLVELVVVMAILGLVLGGITTVFLSGSRAEFQVNRRFQAQEAARLALAAVRADVHSACTVVATGDTLTLSIPITDTSTTPPTAPDTTTQCGTVNAANIKKVIWTACTSPTDAGKFALYRAAATTCPSSGKLVADNLVKTHTGFTAFFSSALMTAPAASVGSINLGETQTVDVDVPVSLTQGTSGIPFDLKERIAVSNTVWAKSTASAAAGCSVALPCFPGPCDYIDSGTGAVACFPPKLS
jgi:prepilin-type N-terminal cleavage/methylation domain-containing protein